MITAAWAGQKAVKEVMVFLQGVGVSTWLAVKIYKEYGEQSVDVVCGEPYGIRVPPSRAGRASAPPHCRRRRSALCFLAPIEQPEMHADAGNLYAQQRPGRHRLSSPVVT